MIILNPRVTHNIKTSAYLKNFPPKKKNTQQQQQKIESHCSAVKDKDNIALTKFSAASRAK